MSDPEEIHWTVAAEQIDPDRWARAIIDALQGSKESQKAQATRWGTWPALALVVVLLTALAALTSNWTVAIGFVPIVIFTAWLLLVSRQSVARVAKQIRSTPSALEPFTFSADPSGTRSDSPSASDIVAWRRYRDVVLEEDLIVLTLDNKTVRILPVAAITSGHSASHAVERIRTWMALPS